MVKDHVKCCNCMTDNMLVDVGEEVCPECGFEGALAWVNPDEPEVEV